MVVTCRIIYVFVQIMLVTLECERYYLSDCRAHIVYCSQCCMLISLSSIYHCM